MELETVHVDDIEPYEDNPRDHSESIDDLKDSIKKFGFRVPIVVDEDNVIVAGHGRRKAVIELEGELDDIIGQYEEEGNDEMVENLKMVNNGKMTAVRAEDLSEEQVKKFRIADNRVQELSVWDNEKLQFEIREMDADEIVGYDDEELEEVFNVGEFDFDEEDFEGRIDRIEQNLEDHHKNLQEDSSDRKIALSCEGCGEPIILDKEEIERKYFD